MIFFLCRKRFKKDEQNEISLNGTVNDFSVDHSSIKEEDTLSIRKYKIVKNKIKKCFGLIKKYLLDY